MTASGTIEKIKTATCVLIYKISGIKNAAAYLHGFYVQGGHAENKPDDSAHFYLQQAAKRHTFSASLGSENSEKIENHERPKRHIGTPPYRYRKIAIVNPLSEKLNVTLFFK